MQPAETAASSRSSEGRSGQELVPCVSVCLATYNGAAYVEEQVRSIIAQLPEDAEIVVVDDASTDDTVERVVALGDPRIRVVRLPANGGHVRAFERAIAVAAGRYVFLSDQDDRWRPGRLDSMLQALSHDNRGVVATSFSTFGEQLIVPMTYHLRTEDSGARFRNLVGIFLGRMPYWGCAMAFRSELKPYLLPIPRTVEAHDLWIAAVGNLLGVMTHLDVDSVERRVHGSNLTPRRRRPLPVVLRSRLYLAFGLASRGVRVLWMRAWAQPRSLGPVGRTS